MANNAMQQIFNRVILADDDLLPLRLRQRGNHSQQLRVRFIQSGKSALPGLVTDI